MQLPAGRGYLDLQEAGSTLEIVLPLDQFVELRGNFPVQLLKIARYLAARSLRPQFSDYGGWSGQKTAQVGVSPSLENSWAAPTAML